jgi:hypothetical protein
MTHPHKYLPRTNLAGQATKQASSWSSNACQEVPSQQKPGGWYKTVLWVWNWSTRNPSRPATIATTATTTPQHHSNQHHSTSNHSITAPHQH